MVMEQKHFHFIGICGKGIGPVANMLKGMGHRVTGSDKGAYDPMRAYLKQTGIEFWVGWDADRMGKPDVVVLTYAAPLSSPEVIRAKELGIPMVSWAEVLRDYLIKPESVVVVGNAGKTTTSALLTWMFEVAGRNPSFMIGGWSKDFPDPTRNTDSVWSIAEGDEFPAGKEGEARKSKIFFYKPKYLLLSGIQWDHFDVFPTEQGFYENFLNVLKLVPRDGTIVVNERGEGIDRLLKDYTNGNNTQARIVQYAVESDSVVNYSTRSFQATPAGISFEIVKQGNSLGVLSAPLFGKFSMENMLAASAVALECGITFADIQKAATSFKGVVGRMDIRYQDDKRILIDDYAHNEVKFKAAVEALRLHFPDRKLVVVAEPNTGNRVEHALSVFKNVFTQADLVVFPEFSMTTLPGAVDSKHFMEAIRGNENMVVIDDDERLVGRVVDEVKDGGVICFMGPHGFRGMIEMVVKQLQQ